MRNILADLKIGGSRASGPTSRVANRETGKLLTAEKYVFVNWAEKWDIATSRAVENPDKRPGPGHPVKDICPNLIGGKNWQPMSFSPQTGLVYIPSNNFCMDWSVSDVSYKRGMFYLGAEFPTKEGPGGFLGELVAWDPVVAFVWGPAAGWLNKTQYENRYKIQTVEGKGLSWDAAIGFARTSKELRDQVEAALPRLEQKIAELATKYGLPNDQPITLHASENTPNLLTPQKAAMTALTAAPSPSVNIASTEREPDAVSSASVNAGKEVFNATCAHCHGTDAVQSERRIDLRRLQLRYGENARATFWTTVHEGRLSKGMPAWKDVLTDEVINDVYAYLITVQTPAGSTN